jgi:ribose 5-phosphate isomerase B
MIIFIGADHRGFNLKNTIKDWLAQNGYQVEDLGAERIDPDDDYPIFAEAVAQRVSVSDSTSGFHATEKEGEAARRGIVICGSGVGVDIVANKFDGIRAGFGINADQVKTARNDDDINVLALGADNLSDPQAIEMVKAFLETKFDTAERRSRRLEEIKKIEENN